MPVVNRPYDPTQEPYYPGQERFYDNPFSVPQSVKDADGGPIYLTELSAEEMARDHEAAPADESSDEDKTSG